ncbi:MAG: UDP-glucose 4-epimerase GalE, partial [Geminicoccaceae bacterium]|nr:UDP-glucose 4-epimerase GalE [Geminicoccaceae bacterium]
MTDSVPSVLVSGGAGYIGSHTVKQLIEAGFAVTVYDNLSSGFAWSVPDAELVVGDLADATRLDEVFRRCRPVAVMHFAANIWVGESVREPARYYRNNVANALNLFEAAAHHQIGAVVFSSTAAVYGEPDVELIDESLPLAPINPYGASKMMAERVLQDVARAGSMRTAILRYFNVAGAALDGSIGEATPNNSHLVKVACETARGLRNGMQINGTDYPTPDGTCIRDYIHVQDLADAHVAALRHLLAGGADLVLNCGYGHGLSVREVLEAVRRITGVPFEIREGPRRPGDPPRLVAANQRILETLDWRPAYDDLELIIETAWRFEQKLAAGAF